MNAAATRKVRLFSRPWVRWSLVTMTAAGVVYWGALCVVGLNPFSAEGRHQRVLRRISRHVRDSGPFVCVNPAQFLQERKGRDEITRAIDTALYNWPFYHWQSTVPEKFAAIADRLDSPTGPDLKTFAGCVELLKLCDEASWTFYDYDWVRRVYDLAEAGEIPPLPKLGERWQNDERRKEYEKR